MKLRTAIILFVMGFILGVTGPIFIGDASRGHEYEAGSFLLQEYMSQSQQSILGLVMTVLGLVMAIAPIFEPWPWVRKVTCVSCQESKTRNRNDEGVAICDSCEEAAWKKSLIDKVKDEAILKCPKDGSPMDKMVLGGTEIVVDNCPSCGGTFLSKEEKEELEEDLGQPRSAGSFSSGIVLGMNIGRMG
jgi:hypothetical protein